MCWVRDGGDWYETAVGGCSRREECLTPCSRQDLHSLFMLLFQIPGNWRVSPLPPYGHDIWLGLVFKTEQRKGALFSENNFVELNIRRTEF